MKKSLSVFSIILLASTLTAFAYYNWGNISPRAVDSNKKAEKYIVANDFFRTVENSIEPSFYYSIGSRFNTVIAKENLHKAKSILDILPVEETINKKHYETVYIGIVKEDSVGRLVDDENLKEYGENEVLNNSQLSLLKSTDYSTDFYLISYCKKLLENGQEEPYKITYHMTVVPEKQAEYNGGSEAFISFLKRKTRKEVARINERNIRAGRLSFVVATDASIKEIKLLQSCGNYQLDEKFVNLIQSTSSKWNIAKNADGESVKQRFVFSFGKMGC